MCTDKDLDGFYVEGGACGKIDCDDTDPRVHPGALRICDGKDNDCDGRLDFVTDVDKDGDGVILCAGDCDDNTALKSPNNPEGPVGHPTCSDNIDNDCDRKTDAADIGCTNPCVDRDNDGYGNPGSPFCPKGSATDCNDSNSGINPEAPDTTCNGIDENCSGAADDGYVPPSTTCGVGACSSTGLNICTNGKISDTCTPGVPGQEGPFGAANCFDGIDNNCNGLTDGEDIYCMNVCLDNDGDGYGANGAPACVNGSAVDCDDANAAVNPGASDANCDGVDNNCSGQKDEGYVVTPTNCGIGACARAGQNVCQNGLVVNTCNPGIPSLEGPLGSPTCSDGIDNNCNGVTDLADNNCLVTCIDNDKDGYGKPGSATCPNGSLTDCDDTDPKVYPGAPRICDGKDNDCDGRLDYTTDVDNDKDGFAVCAGDCNDNNPLVFPGAKEGPFGDPTCSDGLDNNCNKKIDAADIKCTPPTCTTRSSPKDGPHFFVLLNPDGTTNPNSGALDCGKCHNPNNFQDNTRFQCQRCHADPADTSDPLNGTLKAQYPLNRPYGYGSAANVKMHSSKVVGTKYGNWDLKCTNCHNPHLQEQNVIFDGTYGKYIKEYICIDNPVTGLNIVELVEFTSPTGQGSFADGPPHNKNICETCHVQPNHHRRDGRAPGDLNSAGVYVGHYDGVKCTECHLHDEGFKPSCGACHDAPPPTGTHLKHFAGTKDDAEYGNTQIAKDVSINAPGYLFNCGNCHPTDISQHINGVKNSGGGDAQIVLYDPNAPAGSIKSLHPPSAAYVPGPTVFTDLRGFKYTQGTCTNVYCHSGPQYATTATVPDPKPGTPPNIYPLIYDPPWESLVVASRQYASPTWGVDTLGCNGCHGYPILSQYPTVSAGAGDSHAWVDDFGYLNLHAWNMGFDPLQCSVCHHDTVRENFFWMRDDFSIQLDDISIFNRSKHVSGTKDVVFTPDPIVYPKTGGSVTYSLSNTVFDQNTKTCANAPCHLKQKSVTWGNPYRWFKSFECNVCHRR